MWKKIAIAGTTAAVIAGAGTAALAETGSSSAPETSTTVAVGPGANTPSTAAANGAKAKAAKAAKRHPGLAGLRNLQHGTWVTGKGGGADVTHDIIRGHVTAVSATAVTVKAADNTSQTYVISADTKVHTRAKHTGATIADVKAGDAVTVTGTAKGTTLTARQVLDTTK